MRRVYLLLLSATGVVALVARSFLFLGVPFSFAPAASGAGGRGTNTTVSTNYKGEVNGSSTERLGQWRDEMKRTGGLGVGGEPKEPKPKSSKAKDVVSPPAAAAAAATSPATNKIYDRLLDQICRMQKGFKGEMTFRGGKYNVDCNSRTMEESTTGKKDTPQEKDPPAVQITPPAVSSADVRAPPSHILAPEKMETRVECTGDCCHSLSPNNRSCHYSNLYLEVTAAGVGAFYAFVVAGNDSAYADRAALATLKDTRAFCQGPFPDSVQPQGGFKPRKTMCSTYEGKTGGFTGVFGGPTVKVFPTKTDLISFVSNMDKLESRPHVHVEFTPDHNWGHHVVDRMYAAWSALSKFGLENRTMCYVRSPGAVRNWIVKSELDPSSTFGGCPTLSWEELTSAPAGRWIHFDDWVFGISGAGLSHKTQHYESSMYKLRAGEDVLYLPSLFRKRMFDRYSLDPPISRSVSNEHRPRSTDDAIVLRALIIPNKRNWGDEFGIARMINDRLQKAILRGHYVTVNATVLDWSIENTMRRQLELVGQTDIYVSSVGTALTLQPFLPHGSVVANAGWVDGFWEEYMTGAIRYLDAVYPSTLGENRSNEEVAKLVREAAAKIVAGFNIPVARGQALSPIGRAFSNFLQSPEGENLHVYPMLNAQWGWDTAFGQLSGGCPHVIGSAKAAFAWVCSKFNPRCHPSEDYVKAVRNEHNITCNHMIG